MMYVIHYYFYRLQKQSRVPTGVVVFNRVTFDHVTAPLTGYMRRAVEDRRVFPTRFLQLVSSMLHANLTFGNIVHRHVCLWTALRQVHLLVCKEQAKKQQQDYPLLWCSKETYENNMSRG